MPVEPGQTAAEGYHFTEDMTDHAIDWIRQQKALMGDQPVLRLLRAWRDTCPAPRADRVVDRYKGKFDDGWDKLRERTFARQKELGVIPAEAELTARHDEIPGWDDMPDDAQARPRASRWRSTPASSSTPITTSAV